MNHRELMELIVQYNPIKMEWNEQKYSELFGDVFKHELRYNTTVKEWFFYDGKRWREDEGSIQAARRARAFSDVLNIYAHSIRPKYDTETSDPEELKRREENEKTWKQYCGFAWHYRELRTRETLVKDARSVMAIKQEQFDTNKNLFNCQNCTFDFSTMEKHDHRPQDMLTKICECDFNMDADGSKWEKFIDDVMQGDKDKAAYLQRICGYSLTGNPTLEKAFILYGPTTRNGKSTFVESFRAMMGDYAGVMQPESLAMVKNKNGSNASPDIADIAGIRFLSVPEPTKNMILNVALVKALTGGDAIKARKLYKNLFEFRPQFAIFMHCNSLPVVTDDTLFNSERVRIITFDRHFKEDEQNQNLSQELKDPDILSSILTWAFKGLQEFKKSGEQPPQSVKMATIAYKEKSDKIHMFFEECMKLEQGQCSRGDDVYKTYTQWCVDDSRGYGVEGKHKFFKALRDHGLMQEKATVNGNTVRNVIVGYTISSEWFPEDVPFS